MIKQAVNLKTLRSSKRTPSLQVRVVACSPLAERAELNVSCVRGHQGEQQRPQSGTGFLHRVVRGFVGLKFNFVDFKYAEGK